MTRDERRTMRLLATILLIGSGLMTLWVILDPATWASDHNTAIFPGIFIGAAWCQWRMRP